MYFIVHMCNFILQDFEELDGLVRKSLSISSTQKMSKCEQQNKITLVLRQILVLKDRVEKLECCLHTLETDPYHYFQNLNPMNQEYVEWKKNSLLTEKDKENKLSSEEEKEEHGATAASTGGAATFVFFLR